ncbi:sulfatase-like hydrolase/transferase [Haloarcula marina]|uniref:sulfatase-like hydrolase/transferase n=1 Tax=Haloarcula marina TaxID=2961574 RepID=UPI0020B66B6C|nr:sulfatase-like hydrolase/transferase [Halomicroarcula marina]
MKDTVSVGVSSVLRGDLRHPLEWLMRATSARDSHPFVLRGSPTLPSWMAYDGTPTTVRIADGNGRNRYRDVLHLRNGDRLTVDPPQEFDTLGFEVVDPAGVCRLTVSVTFDTDSGTDSKQAMYRPPDDGGPAIVPFQFELPAPTTRATIELTAVAGDSPYDSRLVSLARVLPVQTTQWLKIERDPWLSRPSVNRTPDDRPHVFVVSIDSLRYDYLDALDPLLAALGDRVTVPSEPRVQGTATQQSHGALYTGTHPGIHGITHGTLDENRPTIAELLSDAQYRCSACVSSGNLSPGFGFGRGFYRYDHQEMDWEDRQFDARSIVDTAIEWLETDLAGGHQVFQFLHLFDAHYPYVPPAPFSPDIEADFELVSRTLTLAARLQDTQVEPTTLDQTELQEGDLDRLKRSYWQSLRYVASQLRRFVDELSRAGVLGESLIVVTGDHGEEFFENGYAFHNSLHDENIRPGMVVKTPADSDIAVPETPDIIDLLPTVVRATGGDVPARCPGQPWQETDRETVRITERIIRPVYQLAIEDGEEKAILTYPSNYPDRPTPETADRGPDSVVYYRLSGSESEREERISVPETHDEEWFLGKAEEFLSEHHSGRQGNKGAVSPSVTRRLKDLGYK